MLQRGYDCVKAAKNRLVILIFSVEGTGFSVTPPFSLFPLCHVQRHKIKRQYGSKKEGALTLGDLKFRFVATCCSLKQKGLLTKGNLCSDDIKEFKDKKKGHQDAPLSKNAIQTFNPKLI